MRCTREVVDQLKHDAIKAEALARGTLVAYQQTAIQYWEDRIAKCLDRPFVALHRRNPYYAVLNFSDGAVEVQIVGIDVDYDGDVSLEVHERTKRGKWGKTVLLYDVEDAVEVMTKNPS